MVKKYTNRLNKYHGLNNAISNDISKSIIPSVMKKLVAETSADKKEEKGIFAILNWLGGYNVNFEEFFLKMNTLKMA